MTMYFCFFISYYVWKLSLYLHTHVTNTFFVVLLFSEYIALTAPNQDIFDWTRSAYARREIK